MVDVRRRAKKLACEPPAQASYKGSGHVLNVVIACPENAAERRMVIEIEPKVSLFIPK